jgi:hypothetical protein
MVSVDTERLPAAWYVANSHRVGDCLFDPLRFQYEFFSEVRQHGADPPSLRLGFAASTDKEPST